MPIVVAGDIGGTKSYLGLFEVLPEGPRAIEIRRYATQDYPGLSGMVRELAGSTPLEGGVFGVAGAVVDGRATMSHIRWTLERTQLEAQLGFPCRLCNDLVATASGIGGLDAGQLLTLQAGVTGRMATKALIAAGTGLGQSILYWDGGRHVALASEGGMAGFAPQTETQIELSRWMMRGRDGVCVERVLSGPGLVNIYEFLRQTQGGVEASVKQGIDRAEDKAGAIATAAERGECNVCAQALDLLLEIYGAEAGNLALRAMALGGVYVAGGIAAKLRGRLTNGTFMRGFLAKDGLAKLMPEFPVRVVLDERTALMGAARMACEDWQRSRA